MKFDPPLLRGRLERRYKRFLADVQLDSGARVTAHVPNTGSMRSCSEPGSPVWVRHDPSPRRKLAYTLELVDTPGGLVAVHTGRTNDLVHEALEKGLIPELGGYQTLRRESRWGESRFDFRLERDTSACLVEVKSVTHVEGDAALFPDAVTKRGLKHLRDLGSVVREGGCGVLLFVVQRPDGRFVAAAEHIDPDYAEGLRAARAEGVELLAYRAEATPERLAWAEAMPVRVAHATAGGEASNRGGRK
jgi:sugar fermentation stimulation protein A